MILALEATAQIHNFSLWYLAPSHGLILFILIPNLIQLVCYHNHRERSTVLAILFPFPHPIRQLSVPSEQLCKTSTRRCIVHQHRGIGVLEEGIAHTTGQSPRCPRYEPFPSGRIPHLQAYVRLHRQGFIPFCFICIGLGIWFLRNLLVGTVCSVFETFAPLPAVRWIGNTFCVKVCSKGAPSAIFKGIVEITAQYGRLAGTGRAQHNRLEPYRCGISVPGAIRGRRCCVAVHH
mmetsp:Transcript_14679/g.35154  ORF Transcript_14679/g.35154 Transcript_14679/m.35154 type:complete len:234 (+) Transcript_14679:1308-2009(+)